MTLTKHYYWLNNNLSYLGEIENNTSIDIDDSALIYTTKKGLVIIVGCCHAGIINIIKYAKKVSGCTKIHTIFGGMHLLNMRQDELYFLAQEFLSNSINVIYPCHCVDLNSKIRISKIFRS